MEGTEKGEGRLVSKVQREEGGGLVTFLTGSAETFHLQHWTIHLVLLLLLLLQARVVWYYCSKSRLCSKSHGWRLFVWFQ